MEIIGWIIWGIGCCILLIVLGMLKSKEAIVRNLATRIAFFMTSGVLLTLILNFSKFHLIWWIPASFFLPIFYSLWKFDDKIDEPDQKQEEEMRVPDNSRRAEIVRAEKIVREFSALLDPSHDIGKPAHPISLLRNSNEDIKQAYKDLTLALKEDKLLTDEILENLKDGYSVIDVFIPDHEAQTVNIAVQKIQRGEAETDSE
ncbi:MAG: hypothetical protein LH473_09505, partial [Chitinophagales bacterium]|nr:hypothetical protein [Chitinophagales bacterium]